MWLMCILAVPALAQDTHKVIETRNQHLTREEFNDMDLFIRTVTWLDMEWFLGFNDKSHIYWRDDGVKVYIKKENLMEELSREDSPFTYVNYYTPDGRLLGKRIEFNFEKSYGGHVYIFKDNKIVEIRPVSDGLKPFARPIKEFRELFLKKTGADMFNKDHVPFVVRGIWTDESLLPLFPYYEIHVYKFETDNVGTQYIVHGETGEILFHVKYFPRGGVERGALILSPSSKGSAETDRIAALLKEKGEEPFPLYVVYRKEYGESKSRFYDVFVVKKEALPNMTSEPDRPTLGFYFVDMEKGEVVPRPNYYGPSGSVIEEYQTYLMILDIEKKEKEAKEKKETSWLSRLFHRQA
jgi:hypothetical protein